MWLSHPYSILVVLLFAQGVAAVVPNLGPVQTNNRLNWRGIILLIASGMAIILTVIQTCNNDRAQTTFQDQLRDTTNAYRQEIIDTVQAFSSRAKAADAHTIRLLAEHGLAIDRSRDSIVQTIDSSSSINLAKARELSRNLQGMNVATDEILANTNSTLYPIDPIGVEIAYSFNFPRGMVLPFCPSLSRQQHLGWDSVRLLPPACRYLLLGGSIYLQFSKSGHPNTGSIGSLKDWLASGSLFGGEHADSLIEISCNLTTDSIQVSVRRKIYPIKLVNAAINHIVTIKQLQTWYVHALLWGFDIKPKLNKLIIVSGVGAQQHPRIFCQTFTDSTSGNEHTYTHRLRPANFEIAFDSP